MSTILAAILDFSNILFSTKTAAIIFHIGSKHVFTSSNSNIIKNRVEKKKLEQILLKKYSFLFQTLICIINLA